ncbi:hypothetical protein IJM16_03215 [Candidatus Saccharibacteria bacterium]|nr:hypothetical protein [Candidatus Saccharibacteria bacterium]
MAVKSKVFEGGRKPLSSVSLYYDRVIAFFDAVGTFNEIQPLYESLKNGDWMRPEVRDVFHDKYGNDPKRVYDACDKADADIEHRWNKIIESLNELGLKQPEQVLREFRSMTRARNNESDFRKSLRAHVASCKDKCEKEIGRRKAYSEEMAKRASGVSTSKKKIREPKPIYVETPRKLIVWYQAKPERAAKRRAAKNHQ